MKTIFTAIIVLTAFASNAQMSLGVRTGASHSYLKGVDFFNSIGYYAGIAYEDRSEFTAFTMDCFFTNQFHRVGSVDFAVQSINIAFGPAFYVSKTFPLSLTCGAIASQDLNHRIEGEVVDMKKDVTFNVYAGANYSFGKLQVQGRFIKSIDTGKGFQLGIGYNVFSR